MGHVQRFEFTDPREGAYGATYSAGTEQAIEAMAARLGYSGPIQRRITAFPPPPPTSVLRERAMRDQLGYADDEIPW
jgi:hypothetical protein